MNKTEFVCGVDHNGQPCTGHSDWTVQNSPTVRPNTFSFIGYAPYVCPKCKGEGTENGSKRLTYDNRAIMNCWPCGGTGIVWG